MNGVEILATHEIMKTAAFNWYIFIIGMIIVTVTVIILTWKNLFYEDKIRNILTAITIILIFAIPVAVVASNVGEKILDHTEYKVQLSDEVPIAEFLSTYQIIDQEGQILTIKEKVGD